MQLLFICLFSLSSICLRSVLGVYIVLVCVRPGEALLKLAGSVLQGREDSLFGVVLLGLIVFWSLIVYLGFRLIGDGCRGLMRDWFTPGGSCIEGRAALANYYSATGGWGFLVVRAAIWFLVLPLVYIGCHSLERSAPPAIATTAPYLANGLAVCLAVLVLWPPGTWAKLHARESTAPGAETSPTTFRVGP